MEANKMTTLKVAKRWWFFGVVALLLALTPALLVFAATPAPFPAAGTTPHNNPIGIVETTNALLVTEYCVPAGGNSIFSVSSAGIFTPFGPSNRPTQACIEEYLDISPGLGGFPAGHVYVTRGPTITEYTAAGALVGVFATVSTCGGDHTGITFDRVGTFLYKMIISCTTGHIYTVDSAGAGAGAPLANVGVFNEGPEVVPVGFGLLGGQIWVAEESAVGTVYAIDPLGVVSVVASGMPGAEYVNVIPTIVCSFGTSGGAYFVTDTFNTGGGGRIVKYPASDFAGIGGDALVGGEYTNDLFRISAGYAVSTVDATGRHHEGGTFARCLPVFTPGFWKNHQTQTTVLLPRSLGGYTVDTSAKAAAVFDVMNCGNNSKQTNGAAGCLAGHLLAAKLNVANGGDTCINSTILDADAFLTSLPYTGPGTYSLTAAQRADAIALKNKLDTYNNGGGCPP